MHPNNADEIANSAHPDKSLIWVYFVCAGIFVWKLSKIMVFGDNWKNMLSVLHENAFKYPPYLFFW